MNTGSVVAIVFSGLLLCLLLVCEFLWRRALRRGTVLVGKVVGYETDDDDDGSFPIVEFDAGDGRRTGTAGWGAFYDPPVGESVSILVDRRNHRVRLFSWRHRWMPTLFLGCLVVALIGLAAVSQ